MAETTNSQQQSSPAKTTDESSRSLVQNQSAPDMDTEISSRASNCETGCSTRHRGCVKAKIKCGQRSKCRVNGCDNQAETVNSQQQSSAAQIMDESPQTVLPNPSAEDLDIFVYFSLSYILLFCLFHFIRNRVNDAIIMYSYKKIC